MGLAAFNNEQSISDTYEFDRNRAIIVGGLVFQNSRAPTCKSGRQLGQGRTAAACISGCQNELPPGRGKIVFLSQVLPTKHPGYENGAPRRQQGKRRSIKSLNDRQK